MAAGVLVGSGAAAQDTRTVTEPVIPPSCVVLQAQQAIVNGEPSSETNLDTARIQAALSGCAAGQAVELATSGANNAFVSGPLSIPANVTLVVDGGVTLFGSRNPADYQSSSSTAETCGTVGPSGNGCMALISATGANSGIMGYGVIDGRGEDKLLINGSPASYSWWDNAGTAQNTGGNQDNPILVQANGANFTLYKITFRNSPMFHVKWSGNTTTRAGFTAWGVKVITPFTARNSDGIDPSGANITINHASLSDGDDMVAVSASSAAQNITVENSNTYSGHGISVGSYTQGGLSNMLVTNITQMGTASDGNAGALRIKTAQDRGGLVQNVTYQNICIANTKTPLYLSPLYNSNAGTLYPQFSNITYRNVHVVTEGTINIQGYANTGATVTRPATVNFDNLIFDSIKQSDFSPTPSYLTINIGPGPVTPLLLSQTGPGVTYTGAVTNPTELPYPCDPTKFQYLVGELYGATPAGTNLQAANITTNGSVTLNAMLQPAMIQVSYASISGQGSYTGMPAPTAPVQFFEGTRLVGTGTLSGNGTIASLTLSGVPAGTHTYTAYYPGDSTYTVPLTFGSLTVTVGAASATTTSLTATPATVAYGNATTLTAAVSSTATGTPGGQVVFVDNGTVQVATAPVSGGSAQATAVLGVGSHSLQAVYSGDANFAGSTSTATLVTVTAATPVLTVTTSAASVAYGSPVTLTASAPASGSGVMPTGTINFLDGTTVVGTALLNNAGTATAVIVPAGGSHTYTASYSGDSNYAAATGTASSAVSVSTAATTTTLAVAGNTATGSTTVLTATVSTTAAGAAPTGAVTFYDGTTVVGAGTLSGGTATASVLLPQGTHALTAKYAGDANYAGSASTATAATTVTIVAPFSATATPATLSLAPGATGTSAISLTPAGGFTGSVTLSCASPVSYISCAISPLTQTISGTAAVSATLTVQVVSKVAQNEVRELPGRSSPARVWVAMLLPLAGLGLTRRKRLRGIVLAVLVMAGLGALSGCSGNSAAASPSNLPPAGTQVVTVTASSGQATATTSVSVTVTH